MNKDHFQNQLILLKHHIEDAVEANQLNRPMEVDSALNDMKTIVKELTEMLPKDLQKDLQQGSKEEKRDENFRNYLLDHE